MFLSPEMVSENRECVETLRTMGLRGDILGFFIDEAHCISQWGSNFRPAYLLLKRIRTYVSPGTPIAALSATLAPKAFADVEECLLINAVRAFYLNLGNNRPNIKLRMKLMSGSDDYGALEQELNLANVHHPDEIPKTIIFMQERRDAQDLWRYLRNHINSTLWPSIDFVHALRTNAAREWVLRRFREGEVRILIATECVAMVCAPMNTERIQSFRPQAVLGY